MEQELCEAAIKGNTDSLRTIVEKDELILDKSVVGCFNTSPLHVAASCGHTLFVQELLRYNSKLAGVLDSQQRSALHLASEEGHVEIVKALINASPDMCLAPDQYGKNPLHTAAIKGKVNVLEELVQANLLAARVRVDHGETILHLCVKHNQLETLKLLLEMIGSDEFVNTRDSDGNSILHLAVLAKRFQIVKYVLEEIRKIDVNAINANGHTAMDILCHLPQGGPHAEHFNDEMGYFLQAADARSAKDRLEGSQVVKLSNMIMVVASLIGAAAFQAGMNPPGGVWQDDSDTHRAGVAVMAYNHPDLYKCFLRSNMIGFVGSLSSIIILITGLPFRKRVFQWILLMIGLFTISSMAFTYAFSVVAVSQKIYQNPLSSGILVGVIVWCSVIAVLFLHHTIRLILLVLEKKNRDNAIRRKKLGLGRGQPTTGQL